MVGVGVLREELRKEHFLLKKYNEVCQEFGNSFSLKLIEWDWGRIEEG